MTKYGLVSRLRDRTAGRQCRREHRHRVVPFPPESDQHTVWYCLDGKGHAAAHRYDCGCTEER